MKKTSLAQLSSSLRQLALPQNKIYIIHNSLLKFGIIERGAQGVLECLNETLGADATLLMPAFTFSFEQTRHWDYKSTKSETGALGEFFRKQSGVLRTLHPFHSLSVAGKYADDFIQCKNLSSFGEGSPFDLLYKSEAINIGLGTEFIGGATFLHHTEEMAQVPYRFYKEFPGEVFDQNQKKVDRVFKMFVRDINADFEIVNQWGLVWDDFVKEGLVTMNKLEGANLFAFKIKPTHDSLLKKLVSNPYYCAKKIYREGKK